jgi:uncharacterized protein YqcC (DUF446 family)
MCEIQFLLQLSLDNLAIDTIQLADWLNVQIRHVSTLIQKNMLLPSKIN